MQAVGLHPDVFVVTSRFWQTTCTLVKSGEEAFCVDSPVLPDELELLPAIAAQASFRVVGCIATHADWDHLLGRYAFADAPLGLAESSAARLRNEPGAAQRELREFDEEHYVERPGPLTLPGAQALPVPGHCALGERELELHPADGHTVDGMALWVPWAVGARVRRLPLAGRDPLDLARAGRCPRTRRPWTGWSHSSSGPTTSCRGTGRCWTPRARSRSWARIARTCRRWWSAAWTPHCRSRGGTAR